MAEILIDKNIFISLVQGIMKFRDKFDDEQINGTIIRYAYKDLAFEAVKKDGGKIIPQEVTFSVLSETYYLTKDGEVLKFVILPPFSEEEMEFDGSEDEEDILENYSDMQPINNDENLMKIIQSYLNWRVQVLEKFDA